MKTLSFLLLSLSLFVSLNLSAEELRLRVQSVHDGDTLNGVGVEDGVRYKVRLMGVDAPEVDFNTKSQGEASIQARDYLASMAPVNSIVTISSDSQTDKHGRILGRILAEGTDLNLEMLRAGWGYLYFIYPFDKGVVSKYVAAAREAYENQRGVFSGQYGTLEEPYNFRMSVRFQVGRNPVGDFQTKQLFKAEDYQQVPVWRRVFFPNSEFARANGYN